MWDYRGVRMEIIDRDIGLLFFNYIGSGILSLLWFLVIIGITIVNIVGVVFNYDC